MLQMELVPILSEAQIAELQHVDDLVALELFHMFQAAQPLNLQDMRRCAAAGSWSELARLAHRMKSEAATLGASRVCVLLERFEARAVPAEQVEPYLTLLEDEIAIAIAELRRALRVPN